MVRIGKTNYPRPRSGTRTRRVWDIADTTTKEQGRRAERREVIARYVAEDGNPNTANTQYQYWKTDYDSLEPSPEHKLLDVGARTLKIGPDGRLVIPLEMRSVMELGEDGQVTARVVRGELHLISRIAAVKRIQNEAEARKRPGERVVDEFLAERRVMGEVFDSSALLAITFGEYGADAAAESLTGGMVCAVTAAEVISRYIDQGASRDQARRWFEDLGMDVRPFDRGLAVTAGLLRDRTSNQAVSLGDRACLALAIREGAAVVTADKTWADLDLDLEVRLIR